MTKISVFLLACFMLFAASETFAQGNSAGKGNAHAKRPICHKGDVIWVNVAAIPAHLAHGDKPAVMNAAGEWVCPPCRPDTRPERKLCPDGTVLTPTWDIEICEWVYPDCPTCDPPTSPPPTRVCADGTVITAVWDTDKCQWVFVDGCNQ